MRHEQAMEAARKALREKVAEEPVLQQRVTIDDGQPGPKRQRILLPSADVCAALLPPMPPPSATARALAHSNELLRREELLHAWPDVD